MDTNESEVVPISALKGAFESFITIPMSCLLHLFKKPQINYRSSSTALSNCHLYSFFYCTIPSYNKQAQDMVDLVTFWMGPHLHYQFKQYLWSKRNRESEKSMLLPMVL